jgi:peptidoglycan/LPS O-acetylase OafA/YrhL
MGVIRLFLALSVVVWHLWGHALPFTGNGYIVVILFFIISGFYMSMVINDKYSHLPVSHFYLSRALRIYPLYFIILLLSVLLSRIVGKPLAAPATTSEWLFSALSNVTIFPIHFLRTWEWVIIPPSWSLAIELQFYLAAPFILTRRLWVCVSILAALLLLRLSYFSYDFTYMRYAYPPPVWCFFMLGAVSHRLGLLVTDDRTRKTAGWAAIVALPLSGWLCGISVVKDLDRPEFWLFYLAFTAAIPFIFSISMRSRADRLLGDLSYPIYIAHWLIIRAVGEFSGTIFRFLPYDYYREIDIAVVIIAATASHFGLERPIEKLRGRLSSPSKLVPATDFKTSQAAAPAE